MHIAIESLKLDGLTVIYPGERRVPLAEKIEAIGLVVYVQCVAAKP